MIKTIAMLRDELNDYVNPDAKIKRMVAEESLFRIIRGIYETNRNVSGYYLAGIIYGPSYLSFAFAMSYHGLIPEAVYTFTSVTYEKKKRKIFDNIFGIFTYRDVPSKVYSYGVDLKEENGYFYWIASPEYKQKQRMPVFSRTSFAFYYVKNSLSLPIFVLGGFSV